MKATQDAADQGGRMSTVNLDEDESFPTYSFGTKSGTPAQVPVETVERWRAAIAAYNEVQAEMGEIYKAAEARTQRDRQIAAAEKAVADAQAKLDALRNSDG